MTAPSQIVTREGGPAASFTVALIRSPRRMSPFRSPPVTRAKAFCRRTALYSHRRIGTCRRLSPFLAVDDGIRDGDIPYSIILGAASSTDPAYAGFELTDLKAVNLDNSSVGLLYWVDYGNDVIKRSTLNGTNVQTMVDLKAFWRRRRRLRHAAQYIAIDAAAGKMYWTDSASNRIQRADLDGSNVETVLSGFTGSGLRGIDVDSAGGKIYWTDFAAQKIQRANLDGSGVQDLVTGSLSGVRGLTLDLAAGKMYWADMAENTLRRANLDGSNIETLWTGDPAADPVAIALDTNAGKMYWSDSGNDKILRANLDGTNVETLIDMRSLYPDALVGSLAIDVAAGRMYFSDVINKAMFRANLDGSGMVAIVSDGVASAQGLAIVHPGVAVSPNAGLVTSENGGSATFKVVLDTPPNANVTIPVSSSNSQEGSVSTSNLVFTPSNWNVPQIVTVFGVDDSVVDGTRSFSVVLGTAYVPPILITRALIRGTYR